VAFLRAPRGHLENGHLAKSAQAAEQDRADVAAAREAWFELSPSSTPSA